MLAPIQAVVHGAVITAYMSLALIGIFLAAAQGCGRLKIDHVLNAICITGLLLSTWISLQALNVLPQFSLGAAGAGPFNRNAASVFLALCLPVFYRNDRCKSAAIRWWHLSPLVLFGILGCKSSCGVIAAIAGALARFLFSPPLRTKIKTAVIAIALLPAAWFFWQIDPLFKPSGIFANSRWDAWKHIIRSLWPVPFGRGLASFRDLFPAMYPRGESWMQAHNEYLQVGFEMGLHTLCLILIYLGWFFVCAWRRRRSLSDHDRIIVAGMAAVAVGSMGWHVFHVAPLALIGAAWLGLAQNVATGSRIGREAGATEKLAKEVA